MNLLKIILLLGVLLSANFAIAQGAPPVKKKQYKYMSKENAACVLIAFKLGLFSRQAS